MKKIVFPVFLITFVVILAAVEIFQTEMKSAGSSISEYTFVGVISILFLLGIVFSIKKIKSAKQGLPEKDELSTKIVNKSASLSYFLSLFLWLAIIFINSTNAHNAGILIGYGIMGMAVIFILSFTYFHFRGVNN